MSALKQLHYPKTPEEAVRLLARGDGVRCLAGGASLVAMMNLDLVDPDELVSLAEVAELRGITALPDGGLRIGAMTRHCELEAETRLAGPLAVLRAAAGKVGNPPVRNMGTIGGPAALADPAADYPPALVAADAVIELASERGRRRVRASEFFRGLYETALAPGEIVTAILLLKQIIDAEGIDEKRWPGRQLAGVTDGWKNRALTPEKVPKNESFSFADGGGVKLYAIYQARLRILNACDFGDLLMHMITIFQNHPDVLETYHRKITHLMVDEYLDTNVAQYLWLRLLAQHSKNLCVVGDDDQSIYGWRGAEVYNSLRFEHDFPGAQVVRLELNYRSTGHICGTSRIRP